MSPEPPGALGEEIPRADWPEFCRSFTRLHQGWLASLHTAEPGAGSEWALAEELPFLGLWQDDAGSRLGLDLGAGSARLVHTVEQPVRLRLERAPGGGDAGLYIETADGGSLLLSFRVPARPESLDGLGPGELS